MSDAPPPDWDAAPPADYDSYGQSAPAGGGQRGGKERKPPPPKMKPEEIAQLSGDFYAWLDAPDTLKQLTMLLPDHVDAKVFIATAKTAVLTKPKMLREALRQSLLIAIMKAAGMGLLPDGKQGALVERYDSDARDHMVAFQPMVWGIAKLGRETGAIKTIRAVLVFRGETFRILAGEEDRIEHEVDPDIVEEAYAALNGGRDQWGNPAAKPLEFLARVRASYCFLTAPDGTITRRWMTHQRIVSLFESTKAGKGPWSGRFIDEMILKGVILFTSKWINLDPTTAEAKRFQAALMTDMEIDFGQQGQIAGPAQDRPAQPDQAMLPPPADKLGSLEDQIMGKTKVREKVPVDPGAGSSPPTPTVSSTPGGGGGGSPPPDTRADAPPADAPFIERANAALTVDNGIGPKWMRTLERVTEACPTLDDLAALKVAPHVKDNLANAPVKARSDIAAMFVDAGRRLTGIVGELAGNDDSPGEKGEEA